MAPPGRTSSAGSAAAGSSAAYPPRSSGRSRSFASTPLGSSSASNTSSSRSYTTTPHSNSSNPLPRRRSSSSGRNRPWNNPEELDMLPPQRIQHATGGSSRVHATNPTAYEGSCPDVTAPVHTTAGGSSSGQEDRYDNIGYSDRSLSLCKAKSADSDTPPTTTTQAGTTKKEDAYALYLQQKQREAQQGESNLKKAHQYTRNDYSFGRSSSFGAPTAATASAAAVGRPPRRSPSPSATSSNNNPRPLRRLGSSSASSSEFRLEDRQRSGCEDNDKEQNEDTANPSSARELRARRLAQQQAQPKQLVKKSDNLKLQAHNPAVQAYLARKEQEQQVAGGANINDYDDDTDASSSVAAAEQRRQQRMEDQHPSATRMQRRPNQHVRSSSVGRPPVAVAAKPTNVKVQSNVTTYTYQFQPTPPPPILSSSSSANNNTSTAASSTPKSPLSRSSSDTSVTRARRLLLQSQSQSTMSSQFRESIDGPPVEDDEDGDATKRMSTATTAARQHVRSRSISDPPLIARSSSSGGSHTSRHNNTTNLIPLSAALGAMPTTRHASRLPRSNSGTFSSSPPPTAAAMDCSVTRARRLLQENKKGRSASQLQQQQQQASSSCTSTASNTNSTVVPPPVNMAASNRSSSASAGYHNNTTDTDSSHNNNMHRIPSGGSLNNSQQQYDASSSNNNNTVPTIPRPNRLLQSLPSNLENDDWSIRVSVISAVDFPMHVVPNMPLSPVLKLGLVSIPSIQDSSYGHERLLRDIDRKGLGAVAAEMRCTTTKLLSKRDNGAVEFHEEIRWDHVALKPASNENLALAVELCARGVLRPANLHESPPPPQLASTNSSNNSPSRGRTVTPSPAGGRQSPETLNDLNQPPNSEGGAVRPGGRIANFLQRRNQSRKGKTDASQMESAQAAAAVAKLLVEGSTSPLTPGKNVTTAAGAAGVPPPPPVPVPTPGRSGILRSASGASFPQQHAPQEWDVTLRQSPAVVSPPSSQASSPTSAGAAAASSSVIMTDDIRLGSLLIPLTELEDLQQVLQDRSKPARLEKWFEVQNMNAAIMNSNANTAPGGGGPGRWLSRDSSSTGTGSRSQSPNVGGNAAGSRARRNPSILLELSLYAPDVLDDSEDEMEEDNEEETEASGNVPPELATPKSFAKRTTLQVRNQLRQQVNSHATANAANSKSPKRDSRADSKQSTQASPQDPVLEPGIIDFIAIVGARDIGDQKQDDGSKGWVQSTPECCVLEQFPPTEDFHVQQNRNRNVLLPQKVEWFCFPDGVKLWRGAQPPSASDFLSQQQQQQQASPIMSPSQIVVSECESTSLALFDAYLNCTTSFNWFVIASNSDSYGSQTQKTYGAAIRFYVPAPRGIDPTQDDFAQTLMGGSGSIADDDDEAAMWRDQQEQLDEEEQKARGLFGGPGSKKKEKRRLWVPIGICVTSSLPIVGVMEAVLMRTCEMLASRPNIIPSKTNKINNMIQRHLANLILNSQRPIPGAVNCRLPFLLGEPLKVNLSPKAGLPPLPHGNSVASVCRLLGPEGFIFVLAALLTESKILLHSHNMANCAMVAEVMTALIYPFFWAMPYIPVLPMGMLEFIEAPLSYLLGIPSYSLEQNLVDTSELEDIVVVDLDTGFSSNDWKTTTTKYRSPTPLPSLVASNISRAVYRLLRALENENDFEEKHSHPVSNASDRLPRIHPESKAEREFRIAIALEMGGLVRGYQDCLVFVSTSQPVFNREKFLKRAPALFIEEPSGGSSAIGSRANKVKTNRRILSSRSKRFLSILVNCQHFHQFLEMLRNEECSFFHEVMEMWIKGDETSKSSDVSVFESSSSFDHTRAIAYLSKSLQALEEKVSVYDAQQPHSNKPNGSRPADDILEDGDYQILSRDQRFPRNLLQQIDVTSSSEDGDQDTDVTSVASKSSQQKGGHHASLSLQYLVELEKNPWRYGSVLDVSLPEGDVSEVIAGDQSVLVRDKEKLRGAIGEKKYRAWKLSREQLGEDMDISGSNSMEDKILKPGDFGTTLDLASLMTSATEDTFSETSSQSSLTNISVGSRGNSTTSRSNLTPEQQRVANAKDRDVLRRCLEKAYATKQGSTESADVFTHHGRDLVSQAEVALRNPSAQHFLLSLLSKRSKLDESKKQLQVNSPVGRRNSNTNSSSSSRLEPLAFECVVRLCCAMLDSCMETKDYEPAYLLLCHTAGLFCTPQSSADDGVDDHVDLQPMYMTARIGLHPLFADLGLWVKVMNLHLAEKQAMGHTSTGLDSVQSLPSLSHSESFENEGPLPNAEDEKEYEAAVATLYEMLGYGIPAEELARFSTKVSQEYGWFASGSERGQALLVLARRLSMRREVAENGGVGPGETGDLDRMHIKANTERSDVGKESGIVDASTRCLPEDDCDYQLVEIGWCHPAAPAASAPGGRGSATSTSSGMLRGGGQQTEYMNRSAVTALATFGPSVVVSGGLDGGVFLAHLAPRTIEADGADSALETTSANSMVRGLHLDWGSSGSRTMPGSSVVSSADGEYGVGAVSCLAAAIGAGGHHQDTQIGSTKDVLGLMDDEDMIREMGDSRVIAGTTCGDLRIWSIKDVYAAMYAAQTGEDPFGAGGDAGRTFHSEGSASSSYVPSTPTRRRLGGSSTTDPTAGAGGGNNPFNRLKFSLRGRALSGHRGGVTCVDVPSHVYRPDSVVTGGADGLIKLWSLRTPAVGRRTGDHSSFIAAAPSIAAGQLGRRLAANRGGDALSVLSGHGGRVLCVKTAWHGDRLLSGGADRTIRIWDMMSSGGTNTSNSGSSGGDAACLHTLSGHFGWVTHVQYWGPNTIVSGSTDRSIALWDARVRNSPLFVLRHHHAPISDLLVGSRTDPLMVSAASDGSITSWDFRSLSGAAQSEMTGGAGSASSKHCKVVRHPAAVMNLGPDQDRFSLARSGPVLLSRGDRQNSNTVVSAGSDAVMREWKVSTGQLVTQWNSGHCDALSSFSSLAEASSSSLFGMTPDSGESSPIGTITSSFDGTIRLRRRVPR